MKLNEATAHFTTVKVEYATDAASVSTPANTGACRVGIIGFGPAGMFFCHHLEERRRKLLLRQEQLLSEREQPKLSQVVEHDHKTWSNNQDQLAVLEKALAKLPHVTCFEKAKEPGGTWRTDRVTKDGLWTNGVKEVMEFWDYTFADHFGHDKKLPAFLPRKSVMEYMLARVTRNAPDFVQRYAQLNTAVTHVSFSKESCTFAFQTKHMETGLESTHFFDKCIWAAGENGIPKKPKELLQALKDFTRGPILHSSEWATTEDNLQQEKHLLLIGGSFSAEDIALTALKRGVKRVTIVVRQGDHTVPVLWPSWPYPDKVSILTNVMPMSVDPQTQTIACRAVSAAERNNDSEDDGKGGEKAACPIAVEIEHVDTVILCTGYVLSKDMMENSLDAAEKDQDGSRYADDNTILIPPDWTMKLPTDSTALASKCQFHYPSLLQMVPNPKCVYVSDLVMGLYFYHDCVSTVNPQYMRIDTFLYDLHLLSLDVQTHLLLSCILGETVVPTREEVVQHHRQWINKGMHIPKVRYYLDPNYQTAMRQLYQSTYLDENSDDESNEYQQVNQFYVATGIGDVLFFTERLAQIAKDGHYPVDFGNMHHGLNDIGQALIDMNFYGRNYNAQEKEDVTFRDLQWDEDPSAGGHGSVQSLRSIFTGHCAVPFHSPWMELDDSAHPTDMVNQNYEHQTEQQSPVGPIYPGEKMAENNCTRSNPLNIDDDDDDEKNTARFWNSMSCAPEQKSNPT